MFMATLIARPGALDPALVDSLRNAWGGGEALWLSPDEAAEFPLQAIPSNRWDVWADLQQKQVDLVIQPADGRRKKMLLADMDSTMIEQECIDELADVAGVGDHVKDITARAMNGELDFEGALTERVALLKGLDVSVIDTVLASRITYMPGGRTLLSTMKASGAHCVLVSGGVTAFTAKVAADLGFHENRANTLLVQDGVLTGDVARPILGREAKVAALEEVTARLGLSEADVIAVGDGANDLPMLSIAGLGVAFRAKPLVKQSARQAISTLGLDGILYLLGFRDRDGH